ncbi:MAG: hypothetical protein J6S69_02965 [Proteobacteria bacterium]|nr:hypothetical protein [Pseudomonadota bacterium]
MSFSNHDPDNDEFFQRYFKANASDDSSFGAKDNSDDSSFGAKDNSNDSSFESLAYLHDPSFETKDDSSHSRGDAKDNFGDSTFMVKDDSDDSSFVLADSLNRASSGSNGASDNLSDIVTAYSQTHMSESDLKRLRLFIKIAPLIPFVIFVGFFLWIVVMMLGDSGFFTHISDNEEFDRVAQNLGFEVTHPEVENGKRSVATLEGCIVTFEVSHNNEAATDTYFDLGGSDFSGRKSSLNDITSSGDSNGGKFKATKLETTVLVSQMPKSHACQSKADKLVEVVGYDEIFRDYPMLHEIGRRFSMLIYGL